MEDELKSYPIPIETVPGLDLSHHVADLVKFQNFIRTRGIETKNTRIERYIDYLRLATEQGPINESKIFKNSAEGPFRNSTDWMLYVLREVHEMMWILKGLTVRLPSSIDEKLKIIVGGRDFAALDADSHSRNAQFELRIASYFCQAGCVVELSAGTDIIALTNEQAFYVECKRVGSPNQLAKRLSEAKKQLRGKMPEKHGNRITFGCVAADVTKVAFSHNGLTWGLTNDHSRDIIQEKLLHIASASQKALIFNGCKNLIDYWLQIHIPSLILHPYPPTTITRFSSYHIFNDRLSRKSRKAASVLRDIFESASKADPRDIPAQKLTLRTSINVPKGTTFSLDEGLLMEFLERGEVTKRKMNEEAGTITINGRTHVFSFFDFELILAGITKEGRNMIAKDPKQARFQLLMRMYSQRFPYEESEQ